MVTILSTFVSNKLRMYRIKLTTPVLYEVYYKAKNVTITVAIEKIGQNVTYE